MPNINLELYTDDKLLELIRKDDYKAFERIYNKYWSKLYLSAYNILRDEYTCEDLVQEILVQLWLRRADLQIGSLNAFLHAAIRYQVFKVIRSSKVRKSLFDEIEKITPKTAVTDTLAEKDLNKMLDQGIAHLPEKCREIFTLSRKEHLSTKEIAQRLGIAPKTVENQLTIALRRLRISFGDSLFWIVVLSGVIRVG